MKRERLAKRITSRIRAGGVLLLSNICLISVGFALWTIGGAVSADGEIKVAADDLFDFVCPDSSLIGSTFSLGNDGFIQEGEIVSTAYLSYFLFISAEKFSKVTNSTGNVNVDFSLKESNSTTWLVNNIFLNEQFDFGLSGTNSFDKTGTLTLQDGHATGCISLSSVSSKQDCPFGLRFSFSISDDDKYKNLLASLADSSTIDFTLTVRGAAI